MCVGGRGRDAPPRARVLAAAASADGCTGGGAPSPPRPPSPPPPLTCTPQTHVPPPSLCFLQIKKLSVKRVVSPIARDNLGAPVAGGLYDPALGPLEQAER